MFTDFVSRINWIDVLMVVIVIRILFIGLKNGFITESFKLLGTIFSAFIVLHYYTKLAHVIPAKFHWSKPLSYTISFLILWAVVTFVFKLIRDGLLLIFSVETQKFVDRWGGGVLSSARAVVICGLTFYCIVLAGQNANPTLAKASISRRCFGDVAVSVYSILYDGLVSKFFPDEKINDEALAVMKGLSETKS